MTSRCPRALKPNLKPLKLGAMDGHTKVAAIFAFGFLELFLILWDILALGISLLGRQIYKFRHSEAYCQETYTCDSCRPFSKNEHR